MDESRPICGIGFDGGRDVELTGRYDAGPARFIYCFIFVTGYDNVLQLWVSGCSYSINPMSIKFWGLYEREGVIIRFQVNQ